MAVSMLQLSRSDSRMDVGTTNSTSATKNRRFSCSAPVCHHLLYQSDNESDSSEISFPDGRRRWGVPKGGLADGPVLKFVASSGVQTQKAAVLLQDVYGGSSNTFPALTWIRYNRAVSGATAGVVVEAALYPIDTFRTRVQAANLGVKALFKGLYSGLAGNLVGVLPASAVFVGVYEPVKRRLLRLLPNHWTSIAHLTAGIAGGVTSSLIRVPTEVVKQRMQIGQFVSTRAAVRQIVAFGGIQGLYAGLGSFLLRDLPFDALQICIYEQLKIRYRNHTGREPNDPEAALMGAISGAVAGALTTPLDVVKTRLMIQRRNGQYKGIHDCVMKIVAEEGPSTLLQGLGPRILWIGLGGSIFFGALEKTKNFLNDRSFSKNDGEPAGHV